MSNKKDKKNALKNMLKEKTLLEMSGGQTTSWGDVFPSDLTIPKDIKLEASNGLPASAMKVSQIIGNINGIASAINNVQNYQGANKSTRDNITALIPNNLNNLGTDPIPINTTRGGIDTTKGLPLYIADQISKATGNMSGSNIYTQLDTTFKTNNAKVALSNTPTSLNVLTYPTQSDRDALTTTFNGGNNRYLTLYDLIVDDNGEFLSKDVDLILNRFSGLAQFKHLPALQFLPGASGGGRRKNKSRKLRK